MGAPKIGSSDLSCDRGDQKPQMRVARALREASSTSRQPRLQRFQNRLKRIL